MSEKPAKSEFRIWRERAAIRNTILGLLAITFGFCSLDHPSKITLVLFWGGAVACIDGVVEGLSYRD